jgi:hypothetical protein
MDMMKTDTQHLDYLLSQYVDGCLEGSSKKTLEQEMLVNPAMRELYKEHRDVQDVLDDWGNRIPLINWDEFDQTLAKRLENETVGGQGSSMFRRWVKPLSIAASLAIAVALGYGWHAWSVPAAMPVAPGVAQGTTNTPNHSFALEDPFLPGQGSIARVRVDEAPESHGSDVAAAEVNVTAPGNVEATDSLKASLNLGLPSVRQTAQAGNGDASSAHVAAVFPPVKKEEKDGPVYP